ncbi:MAG: hypothetical protein EXR69_05655 [Myxococcales bacterium]|nr:hypothetical protein [Myxococcales bacterium]
MIESLGPLAPLFLLLLGLGLPVQFALGGIIGVGRRTPASLALLVPALLLSLGGLGLGVGLLNAATGIRDTGDPAWVPWFTLHDRARACIPGLAGALGAVLCVLPALVGAAARVVPATTRSLWPVAVALPMGALVALGSVLSTGGRGAPIAGALAVLVVGAALACVEVQPRSASGALTGVGALMIGGMALGLAHALGLHAELLNALPDFRFPFLSLPRVDAVLDNAVALGPVMVPWVLLAWLAGLPAIFARAATGATRRDGADGVGMVVLVVLPLLAWGWAGLQWDVLSRRAGAHVTSVLSQGGGPQIPMRAPVPPRVLYVLPGGSHWVEFGESGGTRDRAEPTAADSVGPLLHLGDGVIFPPAMTMDDVYFAFADADAGAVHFVSCTAATGTLASAVLRDPLRATGRCGATPVYLRVTRDLMNPVKLIVLKDGLVDLSGEVLPLSELPGRVSVAGRDVVVRAQVDATMADFAAILRFSRNAGRVYLGWGVSLDGEDLPIGINPGLRVHVSPTASSSD